MNGNTDSFFHKKILLVEDTAHDADLTMHAIKKCGMTNAVLHAWNGEDGLALLDAEAAIGLAIVDLKMAGMDGFDFLARLREDARFHGLPVILATGSLLQADRSRAELLGVSKYVVKAVDLADYVNAMCAALGQVRDTLAASR